jgi:hypothetical protein
MAQEISDFKRWVIKTPRFHTDHRAIVTEICLGKLYIHRDYINNRNSLPRFPLQRPLSENDVRFQNLKKHKGIPDPKTQRDRSWISKETWELIDKRLFAVRWRHPTENIHALSKAIKKSLTTDRRRRAEKVGREIEQKYVSGNVHGAYNLLRGWYRKLGTKPPKPTRKDINLIRSQFLNIYQEEKPPGNPIPVHITPFHVNDNIPDEDEVWEAVQHHMRRGKSPGASGISVYDFLYWHNRLPRVWEELVSLVQECFEGKAIPQEFSYEILCLLPKNERGKYRGIALLEVVYKLVSTIIHLRLQDAIEFHPALHGFLQGRGTGTCILEAKLQMQLAFYTCQPLYQIFIDLSKAYDTLDHVRTMSILKAYGVGPHTRSIIQAVWDKELIVPKSGGYFGRPFPAWRGIRQGDVISPLIFNIVVDAIVREWYIRMGTNSTTTRFYADDGRLAGSDPVAVQNGLTIFAELFKRMNLQLNTDKTKAMVMFSRASSQKESPDAYARRFNRSLPTQRERALQKMSCPQCHKRMSRQHICLHQHEVHGTPMLHIPMIPAQVSSQMYQVNFPSGTRVSCPVPGCPYSASTRVLLRRHFSRIHDLDEIVILQEGELPRCPYCRMFTSNVGQKHFATKTCQEQATRIAERERLTRQAIEATNLVFYVGNVPLENVTEYKYLGRVLSADDSDQATVSLNISNASKAWFGMYRVLSRSGADPKTMARFYLAVVQAKLLYGSETWALSKRQLDRLEQFHARCARHLAHRHIRRLPDGTWEYPPTNEVLDSCGLSTIATYVAKRKTTLLQNYALSSSTLYHQCITSTPIGRGAHHQMWWN